MGWRIRKSLLYIKRSGNWNNLASPKGGQPPIDPKSNEPDFLTPAILRFNEDNETKSILAETEKLESINQNEYDAIFFPGGHGLLWGLAEDKYATTLFEVFYNNNKPVAVVCYTPGILKNTKK